MSTMAAQARRSAVHRALAVLRLGRRTVRADGWRAALVVVMIALGIAIAVVVAIAARSTTVPDDAFLIEQFGAVADVRVDVHEQQVAFEDLSPELQAFYLDAAGTPPPRAAALEPVPDVVTRLAPDAAVLGLVDTYVGAGGRQLHALAVDLADPLAAGLVAGPPSAPGEGEVLLSPAAMDALGAGVGDAVEIPGADPAVVVGTVDHPYRAGERIAVLPPGALGAPTQWLVDADDERTAQRLSEALTSPPSDGPVAGPERGVITRPQYRDPSVPRSLPGRVVRSPSFVGTVAAALILTMVGLLAAAAFATGLRRRIHDVGLLGATGASPQQVRQVQLAEALVLGTVGGVLGGVLGLVAAGLGRPLMQRFTGTVVTSIDVAPADILGPVLVGIVAAVAAALWPSLTASRTSTATALAGRVPLRRMPRWLPLASGVVTGLGLLLVALAIRSNTGGPARLFVLGGASVATALGAASLGVPLLGLGGRVADRLPTTGRLVLRDALRQRTRSGATVAALSVVAMVAVLALTSLATDERRYVQEEPGVTIWGPSVGAVQLPVTDDLVDTVQTLLPVDVVSRTDVDQLTRPPGEEAYLPSVRPLDDTGVPQDVAATGAQPVLVDGALLQLLGVSQEQAVDVRSGSLLLQILPQWVVHADDGQDVSRPAVLDTGRTADEPRRVELLTVRAPAGSGLDVSLGMGAELADELGLTVRSTITSLGLARPLTVDEARPVWEQTPVALGGSFVNVRGVVDPTSVSPRAIALGLALLVVLVITVTATALAATESDRDLQTVVAVGADPRVRSRFHGLQSGYHALLGAVVGIPAALLLYRMTQRGVALGTDGSPLPVVTVPWLDLLAVGVGLPLAVGLVMWTLVRPVGALVARRIG